MTAIILFFLIGLGTLFMALGMNRHYRTMFGTSPSSQAKLKARLTGSAVLLLSLIWSVILEGLAIGTLQWIILWGIGATAISFALPICMELRGKLGPGAC